MNKPLFDTIRDIKGRPLTQSDVDRVNAVLAPGNPGADAARYERLLRVVASPKADAGTLTAMAEACAQHFPAYNMTTPPRQAEFIAQIANETGGFVRFVENLNYSVSALLSTFSRARISAADAQKLGRKAGEGALSAARQEQIANTIYGGAWGQRNLGNTEAGDGWRYRGRGALQLTGRANYRASGARLGLPLEQQPDLAMDPAASVLIALDFWRQGKVNDPIDRGNFREARRITNGGAIGLEEVARLRAKLLGAMG